MIIPLQFLPWLPILLVCFKGVVDAWHIHTMIVTKRTG